MNKINEIHIMVRVWGICLIASVISLILLQPGFSLLFGWTAICIMCGSVEWFKWFSLRYETALVEAQLKSKTDKAVIEKYTNSPNAIKEKKEFIERKVMIDCSCGTEAIVLTTDNDWLEDTIELAYWKYGHNQNLSGFHNMVRQIWNIIKTGHPYCDMVILDKKGIQKLRDFLNETKDENLLKEGVAIVEEMKAKK